MSTKWLSNARSGGYSHPGSRDGNIRISQAGRIALALNEAGRQRGSGRVSIIDCFVRVAHRFLTVIQVYVLVPFRAPNDSETSDEHQLEKLGRLPELIFVPELWSPQEITEWKDSDWSSQWYRIGARAGWLDDHVPVLPFGAFVPTSYAKKYPTPAQVAITVSLDRKISLEVNGVHTPIASVTELLESLEKLYWHHDHTALLGGFLDAMVSCDRV